MIKVIVIVFLFLASNIINAQYRVEEISINGELTQDDPYDSSFGRFDAVELYLTKGDVISISLNAEFAPFIALVAPSEKYYVEYTTDGNRIINYLKNISETGTWYLSIAADSTGFGKYDLIVNYMSGNSVTIPFNADYCTSLKYLSEHSKINFFFVKNDKIDNDNSSYSAKINLSKSVNSKITIGNNGKSTYISNMFNSSNKDSSELMFENLINETKNCLGMDWVSKSIDWRKNAVEENIKEELFVIKDKEIKKSIKISLVETGTKQFSYKVNVEIKSTK